MALGRNEPSSAVTKYSYSTLALTERGKEFEYGLRIVRSLRYFDMGNLAWDFDFQVFGEGKVLINVM